MTVIKKPLGGTGFKLGCSVKSAGLSGLAGLGKIMGARTKDQHWQSSP